jgi:hypothetical protein
MNIQYEHTWEYCDLCEHDVVICGACGNNTCNGGSGTVDGKPCEHCDDAYKMYIDTMSNKSKG